VSVFSTRGGWFNRNARLLYCVTHGKYTGDCKVPQTPYFNEIELLPAKSKQGNSLKTSIKDPVQEYKIIDTNKIIEHKTGLLEVFD